MYINKKSCFAAALAGLLCSAAANADTTLTFSSNGDHRDLPESIAVGSGKMRISSGPDQDWMLYDSARNALFIIDDDEQEYYLLDEAQIQALGKTLGNVSSQVDAALANLPKQQRAAARAMLESMLPKQAVAPDIELRTTGKTDTVAGIDCKISETWMGETLENEVCVAQNDALELTAEDVSTMQSMLALLETMLDEIKNNAGDFLPADFAGGSITRILGQGLPIRIKDADSEAETVLESVSHASIPGSQFSLPEGYSRKELGFGR